MKPYLFILAGLGVAAKPLLKEVADPTILPTNNLEGTALREFMRQLFILKNEIPRHALFSFDIMKTDYEPENPDYIGGIIFSLTIPLFITAFLGLIFILFLICRFGCRNCEAIVERDEGDL